MPLVTSYTAARGRLAALWDRAVADHEPVILTRQGHPNVVLVSEEEYESLRETAYLLRSPANAARLQTAYERALRREGTPTTIAALREQLGLGEATTGEG